MATYLWRKEGESVLIKDAKKVAGLIATGEYFAAQPTPEQVKVAAPTKEEADTNHTGKLSNKEVRAAAKAAGMKDWETTRVHTLKERLGYND